MITFKFNGCNFLTEISSFIAWLSLLGEGVSNACLVGLTSPCFVFMCLFKPRLDLQTLSQLLHGNPTVDCSSEGISAMKLSSSLFISSSSSRKPPSINSNSSSKSDSSYEIRIFTELQRERTSLGNVLPVLLVPRLSTAQNS